MTRAVVLVLTLAFILIAALASAQEMHKWKDAEGRWHFSDRPNPSGNSEKVSFEFKPTELPKEVVCIPFKPGEVRLAIPENYAVDSPFRLADVQLRRLHGDAKTAHFSWKFALQNTTDRRVATAVEVKLFDCGTLLIEQDRSPVRTLAPYETAIIDGSKAIPAAQGEKVAQFQIGVGTVR